MSRKGAQRMMALDHNQRWRARLAVSGPVDKPKVSVPPGFLVGAAIGTAVSPGIGTAIGARIGGSLGRTFNGSAQKPVAPAQFTPKK